MTFEIPGYRTHMEEHHYHALMEYIRKESHRFAVEKLREVSDKKNVRFMEAWPKSDGYPDYEVISVAVINELITELEEHGH